MSRLTVVLAFDQDDKLAGSSRCHLRVSCEMQTKLMVAYSDRNSSVYSSGNKLPLREGGGQSNTTLTEYYKVQSLESVSLECYCSVREETLSINTLLQNRRKTKDQVLQYAPCHFPPTTLSSRHLAAKLLLLGPLWADCVPADIPSVPCR